MAAEPESWGALLNSYRSSYGNTSHATVKSAADVPSRFPRTSLTPFGDMAHPNVHSLGADYSLKRLPSDSLRQTYHGRGGAAPWEKTAPLPSTTNPPPVQNRRMFDTLTHAKPEPNADSWLGHPSIDPHMGKGHAPAPVDKKGRRGLFDVLCQRNPGRPRDDSWLGHALIDPAKGRKHNEDPAQLQGRRDLFPIIRQTALHEPPTGGPAPRSTDPLGDKWIGHMDINPRGGKTRIDGAPQTVDHIPHQAFDWTDTPDNALTKAEVGAVGKRAVEAYRLEPPVEGLVRMDPSFPLSPYVKLKRATKPPTVKEPIEGSTGLGMKGCVPQVSEVRYRSHYDLYWHGSAAEQAKFTREEHDVMHQPPPAQIPRLQPHKRQLVPGVPAPQRFVPAGRSTRQFRKGGTGMTNTLGSVVVGGPHPLGQTSLTRRGEPTAWEP